MLNKLGNFSLPEIEEKVLHFWKKEKIFEKSLKQGRRHFVFFEGPPTANGKPGLHHILARSFKDIILRYKTMRGFSVPRRAGWDTHGLPVEIGVEKALGLKSKKDIEKYGVAAFNAKCRESVWEYKDEWEKMTERIGFWLDLRHPYITYENSYIETLWWIFKEIDNKGLLYQGHKIIPWCARCGTGLSSHELALGYKETTDRSVYVKFKLTTNNKRRTIRIGNGEYKNIYILSWTTTPWTLPGNTALAVGKDIQYSITENHAAVPAETLIVATDSPLGKQLGSVKKVYGRDLVGLEYEPLFDIKEQQNKNSHKIYAGDFVTTTDGTGVVHIAPMYGEDDYDLGRKAGLPQIHTVREDGRFGKEVGGLAGLTAKDASTEEKIIQFLKKKKFFFKEEAYSHEYPFCWRCQTPLIYYAHDSWFIAMSRLKEKLLKENKKIKWVPESIKEGRFGEWLRELKDWAISRDRYWGTPLPVWLCDKCGAKRVVGGLAELEAAASASGNRYFLVRHGESENNLEDISNSWPEKKKYHLTLRGRTQAERLAKSLRKEKIDLIISSDITRTRETAAILKKELGSSKIIFDKRLREINLGVFNDKKRHAYSDYYSSDEEKFVKEPPEGESLNDLRRRIFVLIQELEKKHKNKTIMLVSHEYPLWMAESVLNGWTDKEAVAAKVARGNDFYKNAEGRWGRYRFQPRNELGALDLHRPYIDAVFLPCSKCRGRMRRVGPIADVWFDSGAMPFAQASWPLTGKEKLDYPADYIAEGVDQTRGWFYSLLAVGVLLSKGAAYKNVVSLGLVLDKHGQKMSKSKGNVIDPWEMLKKYGADTLRWHFYTVNAPGEPKLFDEADLAKKLRQFILLLYNSYVFYGTYAGTNLPTITKNRPPKSKNILDQWILAKQNELIKKTTAFLEGYEIGEAARALEAFGDDLSRWYIRRSRRRLQKPENQTDYREASATLGFVLLTLSKLLAPFTPFFAEALYKSIVREAAASVHLVDWPKTGVLAAETKLIAAMEKIRALSALALAKRAELGIKVRQPLASLTLYDPQLATNHRQLLEILKDETNVKEIKLDKNQKEEVVLDTRITHALKEEGYLREIIRTIQGLRQDARFSPEDKIVVTAAGAEELIFVMRRNEAALKKEVNARTFNWNKETGRLEAELDTRIDNLPLFLSLKKAK